MPINFEKLGGDIQLQMLIFPKGFPDCGICKPKRTRVVPDTIK